MSTKTKIVIPEVPLQAASLDIIDKKYRLYDKNKQAVDADTDAIYRRVAKALAANERTKAKRDRFEKIFYKLLSQGLVIPAGRIMSNAGAELHKASTSTINCTVSSTIQDSMDGIMSVVHEAAMTLKAGCGIGYEFSTLRPKGAYVAGAGATTSGPLSFMDIFDSMCNTVSSAGGRRGAQMGTFDIGHPDIYEFIDAKREDGRLRQFNLSCLITKDFMEAVKSDSEWPLTFKANKHELASNDADMKFVERNGVTHRVYRTVQAKHLWDTIMRSTYEYADPGFILIDAVNDMNNNWFCEDVRATNPCGEQPLPANGSCLLGSVNLTKFVRNPFTAEAYFDWDAYKEAITIFTRMLDNVVESNGLALEAQRNEILRKRRHGMGYLGLGSAMAMLCMPYGCADSVEFTDKVSFELAVTGFKAGLQLAKEKGAAPIFDEMTEVDESLLRKISDRGLNDVLCVNVGDSISNKDLWVNSRYMQRIFDALGDEGIALRKEFLTKGCRFTHHSSIAPTGTIALSLANNASNGIEPSFAHHYARNILREGSEVKEQVGVFAYELLAYRAFINPNAMPFAEDHDNRLPEYFIGADEIDPKAHVDVQAAAQKWVDSSISKTINCATEMEFADFEDIYMYAYDKGLKGCTTFRFNPDAHQGVLVKKDDLANTVYRFRLDDDTTVEATGDEDVEYNGSIVKASNLYEALKEGRIS